MLTDTKGEINSKTIVGNFNTSLTTMNRSSRQNINKERQILNDTIDQRGLTDNYRICNLKTAEYNFF